MQKKMMVVLLISLALMSLSCIVIDSIAHQKSKPTENPVTVTLLPPTRTLFTLPTETPSEEAQLPHADTPIPESQSPKEYHILYGGRDGVWISHSDGSRLTKIYEGRFFNDLRSAVAPDGSRLALITRNDQGYALILVSLPSGEQKHVAQLLEGFSSGQPDDPKTFVEQALVDVRFNNTAWQSKSGRWLAFIGAINGPTSDLYVYDTQTREVKQLTSDPSQAINPTWSPDGQYILHYGVSWVEPFGGALTSPNRLDGVWAVNYLDGKVISLPQPENELPDFVGWHDREHYLSCDNDLLQTIQISTGWETELMHCCCYNEISQSSANGAILLNFSLDCSENYGEGIFYLASPFSKPRKVFDQPAWELEWIPESNVFFAYPEALISGDGRTIYLPPVYDASYLPAVSTNGSQAWLVYEDHQASVKVLVPGGEWQTILHDSVESLIWDPFDSQRLLIILEDGRLITAQYPDFIPQIVGDFGGSVTEAIYLP